MLKAFALIALCTITSAIARADIKDVGQIFCAPTHNASLGLQRTDRYQGVFLASGTYNGVAMTSGACEESSNHIGCVLEKVGGGDRLGLRVTEQSPGQYLAILQEANNSGQGAVLNCHR